MTKEWKPLGTIVIVQLVCVVIGLFLGQEGHTTAGGSDSNNAALSLIGSPAVPTAYLSGIQMLSASAGLFWMILKHSKKQSIFDGKLLQYENHLTTAQDAIVFGFAKLAESRDQDTGQHLNRIAVYSTRLATALRESSLYSDQISSEFVREIGNSAILHDIGKISVPDHILLKAGPLTRSERHQMQKHALAGGECIQQIQQRMGGSACFLDMAREIAFYHHESWDGSGYPHRLSGEDIPLSARIVAAVDIYDALASKRIYKAAIPHGECLKIIQEEAGIKLDPVVVDAFVSIEAEIDQIREELSDDDDFDDHTSDERLSDSDASAKMDAAAERQLLAALGDEEMTISPWEESFRAHSKSR